jgi:hypothetical protein
MTLRRLLITAPLALLVAVLAHLAGFGAGHELGGDHGASLISSALAALFALAAAATLAAALGQANSPADVLAELRRALPGSGEVLPFAGWLFGGSLPAFWGLELLEGHGPFGAGWLLPVAAVAALAMALAVRLVTRWLAEAGMALAALSESLTLGPAARLAPLEIRSLSAAQRLARGTRRGRAPPR